jgi:anti-anti-sigma regulatory factor
MIDIQVERQRKEVRLCVKGVLDGSAAWRVLRVALRLSKVSRVFIDLSGIDRLLGFGASVLAQGLSPSMAIVAVRPEHRRILAAEGLSPG